MVFFKYLKTISLKFFSPRVKIKWKQNQGHNFEIGSNILSKKKNLTTLNFKNQVSQEQNETKKNAFLGFSS